MKGTDGIIVSSIKRGGLAWNLGIRAGDMLVATSATLGDVSYGGK
jgi:C-terminal processing protease CtpA/Prc